MSTTRSKRRLKLLCLQDQHNYLHSKNIIFDTLENVLYTNLHIYIYNVYTYYVACSYKHPFR